MPRAPGERGGGQGASADELLELGDAFLELDRDWRILRVNANQERLSRTPRADSLGRVLWEVWPDVARPDLRYAHEYRRCMEQRVPVQFQEYFAPLGMWTGVTAYPTSTCGIAVFFRDITATKRGERDRERLAAIVESTDDAIISKDLDGVITTWNRGAERLFGYSADEAVGRPITILLPPDRLDEEDRILRELRAGHRVEHFETARRRKDGARVEVAVTVSPLRDAAGALAGASKIARDVTAQKIVERALRAERDFTAAVLDTVATLVVVLDAEGNIVRFNRACERATGYTAAEARGRPVFDFVPDRELREVRETFALLRTGHFPSQHRNAWRTKDGSERLLDWTNTAITDERGEVRFVIATGVDVTERERVLEALRATEEKFRSVFEQAAIGIGRVSFDDARWIDVNDAFCQMLGYPREQMLRMHWPEMTHPEDVELDLVPFRRMAAGELDWYTVEKRFVHRLGHHVWAKLTLSVVRDARGRPDYEIAIIEDVTDRKRADEAVREADRRKTEFLGVLSHELRNPLAPIRNSIFLLERVAADTAQATRARQVIRRQTEHLTRLVDDLLDVTRISRGKIQLQRETVDLRNVVRRTCEDHRAVFDDSGVDIRLDFPSGPVWADVDPTRIAQVIGNLLHNANKFTPAGGTVTVSLRQRGDRAHVCVRDTGAGMEPDQIAHMFEPFAQEERSRSSSRGGLGLGLSLARGLLALHGGTIAARSEGPGKGSEFEVTLPVAAKEVQATAVAPASLSGASERDVLVIEDNADAARTLADVLEIIGHRVRVARDGATGIALARERRPDVVVCDLGLPDVDGYEVARTLRRDEALRATRLIALSGYAQPEDRARAREAGFDAHLPKPAPLDELAALLA